MTVIGLDDTDSRARGMCTTWVAATLAGRIRDAGGRVERLLLVRLNPAVPYKTRGNAALAVHADLPAGEAFDLARELVAETAETGDPETNPGVVVAPGAPVAVPAEAGDFAGRAVRDHLSVDAATDLCETHGFRHEGFEDGRGVVGALAAVGAWRGRDADAGDWTHEVIAYRERDRWGTEREVDRESVFAAADAHYPAVWDTVDRVEDEAVCVPHTPGPVLYGIRGDDLSACRAVADAVESEPVARMQAFLTNQGTDDHLREGTVSGARDGRAYRIPGTVATAPETRQGGHVFFRLSGGTGAELWCAAFEPTKRFRDRVRALRAGDRLTVCGEVSDGTLKLEKFAVRDLVRTERVTPACPECGRRMSSAGRGQGYRCRDCGTHADGKVGRRVERDLEPGWYEVPPCARRHVAKPLVRGGFDAPTHPER